MKAWQIFVHSLRQVIGNFNGALKVSAILYLVQLAVGFLLVGGMALQSGGPGGMANLGAGFGIGAILALIVTVMSGLWIAVGWHRFVLLGETSGGLPTFRGDRIWAYFLRSLGYGLILIVLGAVWGGIVGYILGSIFANSMAVLLILLAIIVYIPILVVAFRMTAALPAAALGVETPFMAGWNATSGQTADLVGLAVILIIVGGILGALGAFVFSGIPVLAVIWEVATGWLKMMVGVSVLTTLYGHYIENRPLI